MKIRSWLLRMNRKALGLTVDELAKQADISPRNVCWYERGWEDDKEVTIEPIMAEKLLAGLGCNGFDLNHSMFAGNWSIIGEPEEEDQMKTVIDKLRKYSQEKRLLVLTNRDNSVQLGEKLKEWHDDVWEYLGTVGLQKDYVMCPDNFDVFVDKIEIGKRGPDLWS